MTGIQKDVTSHMETIQSDYDLQSPFFWLQIPFKVFQVGDQDYTLWWQSEHLNSSFLAHLFF